MAKIFEFPNGEFKKQSKIEAQEKIEALPSINLDKDETEKVILFLQRMDSLRDLYKEVIVINGEEKVKRDQARGMPLNVLVNLVMKATEKNIQENPTFFDAIAKEMELQISEKRIIPNKGNL